MTRQEWNDLIKGNITLLDGATGSNLMKAGMPMGVCPEKWILDHKDILIELQKEYILAGSSIIYAPTFTCNRIKLEEYGLEENIASMNQELVQLSKEAIKKSGTYRRVYIAGDLTMTGKQLYPVGELMFEELVDVYKEQIGYMLLGGVDLFVIETMMSLQECRAALLAVKETCNLPVMVTLTFHDDMRTLYGTSPETAVVVMQEMGADAVGVNCSTGPETMCEIISRMESYSSVPLIAKPNAGLPELINGQTYYDMEAEQFSVEAAKLIDAGASIIGGCCGTTPKHIELLKKEVQNKSVVKRKKEKKRIVTTEQDITEIKMNRFTIIGEKINPTGRKKLQEEIRQGNFSTVLELAEQQENWGASILDINVGMNGIDEKECMKEILYGLQGICHLPLCIDSSHIQVIEEALRIYPGRALINSISLEKDKADLLLPIARKYGAMFILLPLSKSGLPKDLDEKKFIIDIIITKAAEYGFSKEDILADALITTVGANPNACFEALDTIHYCYEKGIATVCGLSNISFGLPDRPQINSTFLAMAMREGLTSCIADPLQKEIRTVAIASELLLNREEAAIRYVETANRENDSQKDNPKDFNKAKEQQEDLIYEAVLKGKKDTILSYIKQKIEQGMEASAIVDEILLPAINKAGDLFEQKIYFLPQLIGSAETMKKAIDYLEPYLKQDKEELNMGTIVMATVEGDIHDIGKNLVVLMLKNYGFEVIDLGKDVPASVIIEQAKLHHADIIGLSALMTTTMMEMKKVIELAKKEGISSKIIVGGAVITENFAKEIGADGYSKDAKEAVTLAKYLMEQSRK